MPAATSTWFSILIGAVGVGNFVVLLPGLSQRLDPFHPLRDDRYLGAWARRQKRRFRYLIVKEPPDIPALTATMTSGFCGENNLRISRLPSYPCSEPSWAIVLALLHKSKAPMPQLFQNHDCQTDHVPSEDEWIDLPTCPLVLLNSSAGLPITRITFITLLVLTNARPVYSHSEAAGYRAAFASYCGQWYVDWPIGGTAVARLRPHDSHTLAGDAYPPTYGARVDKCMRMVSGVIVTPFSKIAFPGRKPPGNWSLLYVKRGFPGAHGSRHLYNMNGGKVYEIDLLAMTLAGANQEPPPGTLSLTIPSLEHKVFSTLSVSSAVQEALALAMDCLPWSAMSWSIHRGLRDILIAFCKPKMDLYRDSLAENLKAIARERSDILERRGWDSAFVRESIGELAASAIEAGRGNSGDLVRVAADLVLVSVENQSSVSVDLDETRFWRTITATTAKRNPNPSPSQILDADSLVALTKCFVLEWSIDFDYQMYHDIPVDMVLQ